MADVTGRPLAVALLVSVAVWLWLRPHSPGSRLWGQARSLVRHGPAAPPASALTTRLRRPAIALAALVVVSVVGGPTGWLLAAVAVVGLDRWTRRAQPRAVRDRLRRREAALPTAVDLLVACLRSGAHPQAAVAAVIPAVPGDLAADLSAVATRMERGATPAEAWAAAAVDLQGVARVMRRSATTGAPAADLLDALALDLRAQGRARWLDAARSLGVKATAPLGLCFLPGFALLGVVPVVIGLADDLW